MINKESGFNTFEIYKDQCIGKGSFSHVYKGINKITGINVAIKEVIVDKLSDKIKFQLYEEVEIMKKLIEFPHQNIVKCYDIFMENKNLYIVMEFCDCGDLGSLLKMPIKEVYVQYWMCQLKNGLMHLNKHNILHRDIKPKNILLTNKKRVLKIADFGFAQILKPLTKINTLCGSPLYMAPEILNRSANTSKTDLWSIGMIIYEMLFNTHPLRECNNVQELVLKMKQLNITIPPPKNSNSKISKECHALLIKLLQKNVVDRLNWEDFFNDIWINRFNIKIANDNDDKNFDDQISLSFKSIVNPLQKMIIEDDKNKIAGINEIITTETKEDSNILEHSHYCIFDIDGSKSSNPSFSIIDDDYFQ